MSYYNTPSKKRSGFINDASTIDYETRFGGSRVKYDGMKSRFDEIMSDVHQKSVDYTRGTKEVAKANTELANYLRQQQLIDIQNLEDQNITLKKQLNKQFRTNNDLLATLALLQNQLDDLNKRVTDDKDLKNQNDGLKRKLLQQNDDYNKLYYELELLKSEGDKIRQGTKKILARRLESY